MAQVYQVPQHAFVWLMATAFLAPLPHLIEAPIWLAVLVPVVCLWRIQIQRGRLKMASRLTRVVLLVLVVLATLYSHGTILGAEAGTTLLIAAFALKLVEMFRIRDAYVVIVMGYFVLATAFLPRQDVFVSIYVFLVLILITASLLGVNQPEYGVKARSQLKASAVMIFQAIPLMLVLFVLVPRIAPLWSLPQQKPAAKTGMSESMSPGDVSRLSLSTELAFRAEFEGPIPPANERYWRGMTLSWFDGRTWNQAVPNNLSSDNYFFKSMAIKKPDWFSQWQQLPEQQRYQYRVLLEPTQQRWLFSLGVPFASNPTINVASDFRLVSQELIREKFSYQVESHIVASRNTALSKWERAWNLRIPEQGNDRARALAIQWRSEVDSDAAFLEKVLNWFTQEAFFYTLEPPALGEQPVDEFLFQSRRGFCEHYASAFTFMMRAAGIPARVVGGYQGGEKSDVGQHLLIYQYDAHAWSEIWLPGQGWVEVDPTAAVAPARIEFGLREALAQQGQADELPGLAGLRDAAFMQQFRHLSDYLEYNWAKWVLGYNQQSQLQLMSQWLGVVSPMRIAMVMGAAAFTIFALLGLWLYFKGRKAPLPWWQKEYWLMRQLLEERGVKFVHQSGARTMAADAAQKYPAASAILEHWACAYEGYVYKQQPDSQLKTEHKQLTLLRKRVSQALRQN